MRQPYKSSRASAPKKRRPKIELTSESTFDDYCRATYDPDRGMFGDKSELTFDKQLSLALRSGTEKWKEVDRRFVTESEKRRRGKKGWSKAKRRRKANENKYPTSERDKEPDFKNMLPSYPYEKKNWAES